MSEERPKISVDALALREVLVALNGPGHHIRELQATRGPLFPDNAITVLTDSFNAAVKEQEPCASRT